MSYRVLIEYRTGDSFSSEDTEQYLDGTWEDLDIVKENITRIKEHYEWLESITSTWRKSCEKIEKPKFAKDEYSILLKLDNGKEYQIHTFWAGYFEELYSASVERVDNLPSYKRRK